MRFLRRQTIPCPAGQNTFFDYSNIGAHGAYITATTAAANKRLRIFDLPPLGGTGLIVGDVIPLSSVEDSLPWMLIPLTGGVLQFSAIDATAFTVQVDFYDATPGKPAGMWIANTNSETFAAGGGSDSITLTVGEYTTGFNLAIQCTATGTANLRVGDANNFAFVSGGNFLTNGGGGTVFANTQNALNSPCNFLTLDIVSTDLANPNTFTWYYRVLL